MGDTYYGKMGYTEKYANKKHWHQTEPLRKNIPKTNWLQPKQLLLIPSRLAVALQEDSWVLRNDIVWAKPNHMPSPVRDRLTNSWEHVFHFVKSQKYFYDLDAIRVPHNGKDLKKAWWSAKDKATGPQDRNGSSQWERNGQLWEQNPLGKNPSDFWEITTQPFKGAHFAVFPEKLVEPMIKSSCPLGGIVLDPFCGSGTTLVAAKRWGRQYVGIDLKPEYCTMAEERLKNIPERLDLEVRIRFSENASCATSNGGLV